jgi:hypothetical protein
MDSLDYVCRSLLRDRSMDDPPHCICRGLLRDRLKDALPHISRGLLHNFLKNALHYVSPGHLRDCSVDPPHCICRRLPGNIHPLPQDRTQDRKNHPYNDFLPTLT